jgi:hypothetical protein
MEIPYNEEYMHDEPYFNFGDASENYGFDFPAFIKNGFAHFVTDTFIHDFILFRKSYIIRDYDRVRFFAHKFKGSFK